MQTKLQIKNLQESSINDLIYVCSFQRLSDPIHQVGMELKRQWLRHMLTNYGVCAKIAYYNEKPAAQILFYPEEADPTKVYKRKGVLIIQCVYNPTSEAQKLGIGTRLLQSVIKDAKERKTCLGNQPCRFIVAKAFNTGELLPMPEYEPLSEDREKAIIFYGPICQFSFTFAKRIQEIIREVAPHIKIEMINEWEKSEESKNAKTGGYL